MMVLGLWLKRVGWPVLISGLLDWYWRSVVLASWGIHSFPDYFTGAVP
jgi:hypothetical protein